jgi:hypothetical protein
VPDVNGISINRLTDWVSSSKSWRIAVGFSGSAACIALFAASQWVPENWILWVQWPIYGVFLLSLGVVGAGVLVRPNEVK